MIAVKHGRLAQLLRECEGAVQGGDLGDERLYSDSGNWVGPLPPSASLRDAFQNEFHALVREAQIVWGPLGTPPDVSVVPDVHSPDAPSKALSIAVFPKAGLFAYVVLRESPSGRLRLSVGVVGHDDADSGPGASGGGDEARAALPIGKWVM